MLWQCLLALVGPICAIVNLGPLPRPVPRAVGPFFRVTVELEEYPLDGVDDPRTLLEIRHRDANVDVGMLGDAVSGATPQEKALNCLLQLLDMEAAERQVTIVVTDVWRVAEIGATDPPPGGTLARET